MNDRIATHSNQLRPIEVTAALAEPLRRAVSLRLTGHSLHFSHGLWPCFYGRRPQNSGSGLSVSRRLGALRSGRARARRN